MDKKIRVDLTFDTTKVSNATFFKKNNYNVNINENQKPLIHEWDYNNNQYLGFQEIPVSLIIAHEFIHVMHYITDFKTYTEKEKEAWANENRGGENWF